MKQASNQRRSRRGNGGKRQSKNSNFDSNGPDIRVRGNAQQVLDKYLALARDAASAGDRVASENYYQHAEHYYRVLHANSGDDRRNGEGGNRNPRPVNTPANPDGAAEAMDQEALERQQRAENSGKSGRNDAKNKPAEAEVIVKSTPEAPAEATEDDGADGQPTEPAVA